jgi:hypothetical protein
MVQPGTKDIGTEGNRTKGIPINKTAKPRRGTSQEEICYIYLASLIWQFAAFLCEALAVKVKKSGGIAFQTRSLCLCVHNLGQW